MKNISSGSLINKILLMIRRRTCIFFLNRFLELIPFAESSAARGNIKRIMELSITREIFPGISKPNI